MIRLITEPFDPGAELAAFCAGRTDVGGVVSFVGLARGEAGQEALTLEAYPGLTEAEIAKMIDKARARFALSDALVIHRHGPIQGGEAIVIVLTAAPHRREAFEACDMLMDYLKSQAPFWKSEPSGEGRRWIEPVARDFEDLNRWETT